MSKAVPSYPLFCRPETPDSVPIQGDNGTVHCIPTVAAFLSMFPSNEIHWCYRGPRTQDVPIPPIVDLPSEFIPQYAIFSWVGDFDVRVFVEADDRGICISSLREKHVICVVPARVLPGIEIHVVPYRAMSDAATQIFKRFVPPEHPVNHQ